VPITPLCYITLLISRFFSGDCYACQFFESAVVSKCEKCEVPADLWRSCGCSCVAQVTDSDGASDRRGITPLHVACRAAARNSPPHVARRATNFSVIKFLVERGAAVNAASLVESCTPMQVSWCM